MEYIIKGKNDYRSNFKDVMLRTLGLIVPNNNLVNKQVGGTEAWTLILMVLIDVDLDVTEVLEVTDGTAMLEMGASVSTCSCGSSSTCCSCYSCYDIIVAAPQ